MVGGREVAAVREWCQFLSALPRELVPGSFGGGLLRGFPRGDGRSRRGLRGAIARASAGHPRQPPGAPGAAGGPAERRLEASAPCPR